MGDSLSRFSRIQRSFSVNSKLDFENTEKAVENQDGKKPNSSEDTTPLMLASPVLGLERMGGWFICAALRFMSSTTDGRMGNLSYRNSLQCKCTKRFDQALYIQ
ncbi:MAG: hypothetical protein ORN28_11725 [Rhodoferax sp.]|jgi:hypothetical protein|nr:hypothetical protein [Rhodoferax sp.]